MDVSLTFEPEFDALYNRFSGRPSGNELLSIDGISKDRLDIGRMSHKYFQERISDSSINLNSNMNENKSPVTYAGEIVAGPLKLEGYYLLWRYARKMYGMETADNLMESIWRGDVKFHDPSGIRIQIPYCWAFSTDMIMLQGNPYGQLHDLPPKTADSFMSQVIEATHRMAQEFAGATAPSDLLINYSYFAKKENLTDKQIVNHFQRFVHSVNKPFRPGGESPFTNISLFDHPNLQKLFGDKCWPDGSPIDISYVMRVQTQIGQWFSNGDPASGLPYRFPVMTVNIMIDPKGQIIDRDFLEWVAANNIAKGAFNIYINDGAKLATCCRYSSNFEQMKYRADSFGNGGMNIGSHRVVTVNLPRVAIVTKKYQSSDKAAFYQELDRVLEITYKLLMVHREGIIARRIRQGFLQFFSKPLEWFNIRQLFSTIGITGIYEMCEIMGKSILTQEGEEFATEVLQHIEDMAVEFSNRSGYSFNVEEIPGESACVSLASMDRILYDTDYTLYSNQYIPLTAEATVSKRIILTGKFMNMLSGGGIIHINLKDKVQSVQQMVMLIEFCAAKGVNHLAINYGFGICINGHTTIAGNDGKCPECGGEITDWMTRIIGYFSFVSNWNSVRRRLDFMYRKFKEV